MLKRDVCGTDLYGCGQERHRGRRRLWWKLLDPVRRWRDLLDCFRSTPAAIASIAVQEDVDIVGLSLLSGSHLGLVRKTLEALKSVGADEVKVVVGGTIPEEDVQPLLDLGVAAVYPTGTPTDRFVSELRALVAH